MVEPTWEPERLSDVAVTVPVHEARPVASVVSTFPTPGDPPVICICQAILSFASVSRDPVHIPIVHPLP